MKIPIKKCSKRSSSIAQLIATTIYIGCMYLFREHDIGIYVSSALFIISNILIQLHQRGGSER